MTSGENEMSSSEFEEIDFEPIIEKWNYYHLKDGSRIRGRVILLKLLAPRGQVDRYLIPGSPLQAKTTNIFVVSAPSHLKGPPGYPLTPDEVKTALQKGTPVEVSHSDEHWNEYKIIKTGEVFKIKLVVSDVYRLPNRFDPEGEPVYIITNTIAIAPGHLSSRLPTP